jgi:hypothetical protein
MSLSLYSARAASNAGDGSARRFPVLSSQANASSGRDDRQRYREYETPGVRRCVCLDRRRRQGADRGVADVVTRLRSWHPSTRNCRAVCLGVSDPNRHAIKKFDETIPELWIDHDCDRVSRSAGHLFLARPGRLLEHYSHIRIDAKRQALDALDVQRGRVLPEAGEGNGGDPQNVHIKAMIDVPESVTSQSRHSLTLSGSPPHGKLLIPLSRRDVRVVEGARLESVCRGNSTVGSNPTLSANP